jgi:AsmA protein
MKLFKKILLFFVFLFSIIAIFISIIASNINSDKIKNYINQQISFYTQKNSTINGEISWQLFPTPRLKITQVHMGNPKTKENYTLDIDKLTLRLKISSLLTGKFVFNSLLMTGATLHVNLDVQHVETKAPKSSSEPAKELSNHSFSIKHLLITNGNVVINNANHSYSFNHLQLAIDDFNLNETPYLLQLKSQLSAKQQPSMLNMMLNFNGRAYLSPSIFEAFDEGLSKSYLEGQLLLNELMINKLNINHLKATMQLKSNTLVLNPLTIAFYEGQSIGDLEYHFKSGQMSFNLTGTNIESTPLFSALFNHNVMSGEMNYSFHSTLNIVQAEVKSITGKGTVSINNGVIYHLNIQQMIEALKNKLLTIVLNKTKGIKLPFQPTEWDNNTYSQGDTPFNLLSIQYEIKNEIVNSDSFILQTDQVHVKGSGELNLKSHEVKAKFLGKLVSDQASNPLDLLQKLMGSDFPFEVSGTLEHPVITPNLQIINSHLNTIPVTKIIEKPINSLKGQLQKILR